MNRRSFLAMLGVAPGVLPTPSERIDPAPPERMITLAGWQLPAHGMLLANIGTLTVGSIRAADRSHQLDVATGMVSYF